MLPILALGIGLLAGCSDDPPATEGSSGVRASEADPEMCVEHGVLEAVCTRCNPTLIPVFQAKGDWCAEHGFPESFCPICNPDAGGRPAAQDLTVDGSPPDGTKVRFKTRDAAELAGIEAVAAVEAPWIGGIEAVARLDWDATRVALVSARSPGVVTSIGADVGTTVKPGTVLATLRSAHVGGDRSRVSAARRAVSVAEAELARKRELLTSGVTSEREVLAAEQALATAEAEAGALEAELGLVGGGSGDAYAVTAPLAGVVTERHVSVGQSVVPETPLFQVVDPSRMWAELDVSEADLGQVHTGQAVSVVLDAMPDSAFEGTLDYLAPSVDPKTRTTRGRVVLENPDGTLRAHMYGVAKIVTDSDTAVVTVPSAAVQAAGDVHLVFVRESEDSFVGRRVRVIARSGDQVRIAGPVKPGDPVVTTGSFLLKTETLKDSIGAGCCDVE
jgi:cobalt-zinc-cadmium efflux system membrane fusion protein